MLSDEETEARGPEWPKVAQGAPHAQFGSFCCSNPGGGHGNVGMLAGVQGRRRPDKVGVAGYTLGTQWPGSAAA